MSILTMQASAGMLGCPKNMSSYVKKRKEKKEKKEQREKGKGKKREKREAKSEKGKREKKRKIKKRKDIIRMFCSCGPVLY